MVASKGKSTNVYFWTLRSQQMRDILLIFVLLFSILTALHAKQW